MIPVVSSETGMAGFRLMLIVGKDDILMIYVRFEGIPDSEETL